MNQTGWRRLNDGNFTILPFVVGDIAGRDAPDYFMKMIGVILSRRTKRVPAIKRGLQPKNSS